MKRHAWKQIVLGALIAVFISISWLSLAQEKGVASAKSQPASHAAEKAEPSRGGPQEGIKVHGHWTIVIKNPDGTVASHHEFENSLTSEGIQTLTNILGGNNSVFPGQGGWGVELDALPAATYYITQPNFPDVSLPVIPANPPLVKTLSVSNNYSGGQALGLSLSGTTKFSAAASITRVRSLLLCANYGCGFSFTAFDLSASPIAVKSGQSVDVSVTISFS